jgi:hypothetical protein
MWEMKGDTPKQICNMHTSSRKRYFQRTPNVLNDVQKSCFNEMI